MSAGFLHDKVTIFLDTVTLTLKNLRCFQGGMCLCVYVMEEPPFSVFHLNKPNIFSTTYILQPVSIGEYKILDVKSSLVL